jgi:CRP-like cAMP-binding protein
MEKVLALHEVDLFGHMSTEELAILAAIAEVNEYAAGEAIFQQNEPADSLNLIVSGSVQVRRGKQDILTAGPNDTLGAMSLLDGEPWPFSTPVKEPATVLRIDRETFLDVIADHPRILEAILRNLVTKVRRLVNTEVTGPASSESETSTG